uniref:Uncharacterized protein n=1 Tax=Arundo donax TaxID=35708 RepID=A0A0A9G7V6_ARUDO
MAVFGSAGCSRCPQSAVSSCPTGSRLVGDIAWAATEWLGCAAAKITVELVEWILVMIHGSFAVMFFFERDLGYFKIFLGRFLGIV